MMTTKTKTGFSVSPMRCNADNYAYLVRDHATDTAVVIDAGEKKADSLFEKIKELGVELSAVSHVFTTHKHWDHSDGNADFLKRIEKLTIVAPKLDNVPSATFPVSDGDEVKVGNLVFRRIHTPCHTKGSMCFLVRESRSSSSASDGSKSADTRVLFTGDTLFTGGCGRFFEGTGADMYDALVNKIGSLDDSIKVYSGHEYTVGNLQFGLSVDPDNTHMQSKLKWALQTVNEGGCTQPSTIGEEKQINVFMRVKDKSIQAAAKQSGDPVKTMDALRTMKNEFKPPKL